MPITAVRDGLALWTLSNTVATSATAYLLTQRCRGDWRDYGSESMADGLTAVENPIKVCTASSVQQVTLEPLMLQLIH